MKRTQLNEIKNLEAKTILAKIADVKKELVKLQLEKKVKDLKSKAKKRNDLAQLLTILRQKQLLEKLEKEVTK